MISSILLSDGNRNNIINKKRFFDEFTGNEIAMPCKNPKPIDYEKTFSGNSDDTFRIGLSVTKKSLKVIELCFLNTKSAVYNTCLNF